METCRSILGRLLCPLCCGLLFFVLLLLDGSASSETYAVDVEVKDASNITCLYAKWMMNFSITYESNISEYKNIAFMLPQNVKYDGSSCGDETSGPQLSVEFGTGNVWSINFTKTNDTYQGNITFIYNTDDVELFPDAKRKDEGIIFLTPKLECAVKFYVIFSRRYSNHVTFSALGDPNCCRQSDLWIDWQRLQNLRTLLNNTSQHIGSDGPIVTSAYYPVHPIQLNTVFTCRQVDSVTAGNVTNDFWNVSLQAFLQNGSLSTKHTHCDKDAAVSLLSTDTTTVPTTTVSSTTTTEPTTTVSTTTTTVPTTTVSTTTTTEPTTTVSTTTTTEPTTTVSTTTTTVPTTTVSTTTTTVPTTTVSTTTKSTTTVSTTTATEPTTTVPTTTTITTATTIKTAAWSHVPLSIVKVGEKPVMGNYSVNVGTTSCLLASMGLQLNISKEQGHWLINIDPNSTVATGKCGERTANLKLNDNNNTIIDFLFAIKNTTSDKFYLKGVNITLFRPGNGSLFAANNNLSSWEASLGSSYMCRKEETLVVTEGYRIMTFDLRVEPFNVKENKFSTAQECSLDDDTILIPIAVGTALVILIVFIVLAYVIGRRKGYAGYQTL